VQNKDKDWPYQLMSLVAAGMATEEQKRELYTFLEQNEEERQKYLELLREVESGEADEVNWAAPEAIMNRSMVHKSFHWRKVSIAASIAAVLLIGAFLIYRLTNHNAGKQLSQTTPSRTGHGTFLTLADGQEIDVDAGGERRLKAAAGKATLVLNAEKLSYQSSGTDDSLLLKTNSLSVPVGKDYQVELSDGSKIWLNSATVLHFPFKFSGKTREITIEGEAYLEVAKDPLHPFTVHSGKGTVEVLGTTFNINSYIPGRINVALVEGSVKFEVDGSEVKIKPGLQGEWSSGHRITLTPFDDEKVLSWRQGIYLFDNAGLPEIINILPRWYGIKVIIDDHQLSNQRYTGVMDRNAPIAEFLTNLRSTMSVNFYFDKDSTLHFK